MNKKFTLSSLLAVTTLAVVGVMAATQAPESAKLFANTPSSGEWHHYKQQAPTSSSKGTREYWVECGGGYQFTEPTTGEIVEEAGAPDTSEFAENDDRYISYQYDENHLSLSEYAYGAGMYCTNVSDFKNWRITYLDDGFNCNLYSEGGMYLWRIDLPRIDFTKYPTVTMNMAAPNWYENNHMGPEADDLPYHTVYGGNKANGKINLSLKSSGLYMKVIDMEYGSATAFERTFTDSDIINGLKSAYFYTEDLYDRYLNITDIALSTAATPEDIYSYAGDTSKISAVNGDVMLPGSKDYSIISNGYGTNDNSLVISGNANPGAAVITLPAINFNEHTVSGKVSFKFGVKNNGEHMYFGSGDSKVDLGANSSTSESTNNNGYVNWEMFITSNSAYVHNTNSDHDYAITLTAAMRSGTERIVISGGATSIFRVYFITDFYWNA